MDKQELYAQLPKLTGRLFTFGIGAAVLFLLVWYLGGYHVWGGLLDTTLSVFAFPLEIHYEPGSTTKAALFWSFSLGGKNIELNYLVNQLNSNMVVLITLLATWVHGSPKKFFQLFGLCLVVLLLYQSASVLVQLYQYRIGPDVATTAGIFWEETNTYLIVRKIAAFDKFILRYFAWIPVFILSLVGMYFLSRDGRKKKKARAK